MEVKSVMDLKTLPHTFILPNGVRIAVGDLDNFVNCRLESCIVYKNAKVKKVNAVYYVPWDPLMIISFRKATLKNIKDVRQLLENTINMLPDVDKLLIRYNYFSLRIYDKFVKGKVLEFPLIAEVNGIKLYKAIEPPNIYIYDSNMNKRLDEYQFSKVTYLRMSGNDIEFEKSVLLYQYLGVFDGYAELIYIPENTRVTISDGENKQEIMLEPSWVLISDKHD